MFNIFLNINKITIILTGVKQKYEVSGGNKSFFK